MSTPVPHSTAPGAPSWQARVDLFLISLLILFLELSCIRWFPAHVLFLTFFTNTMLLACFLGMSVGCLAAGRRQDYLVWTPLLLAMALASALLVDTERRRLDSVVDVGHQNAPQLVFFGVDFQSGDPSKFVIPIEVITGVFFVVVALALVGPGQQLGRALKAVPDRVIAYSVNIAGSIAGIALFAAASWLELSPIWWFLVIVSGLGFFLAPGARVRGTMLAVASAVVLLIASSTSGEYTSERRPGSEHLWSPYYRIDYEQASRLITVNLIGHQQMVSRAAAFPAYALPHLLNRDVGRPAFADVLIIGAGSGNDVSRALQWGARHVDAVEIDPVIYRLGRDHHPDKPYQDPRVTVHLDDGRNFLQSTPRQYDLIVYALVDSLVLHSGYSNIRLESYLFTTQAFDDVRKHLKPDGLFVMYNYFRQGWIVARLQKELDEVFGTGNPIVLNLPTRSTVHPDDVLSGEFTMFFARGTSRLRDAFARRSEYWMPGNRAPSPNLPNGFEQPSPAQRREWQGLSEQERVGSRWLRFMPTRVVQPDEPLELATDNWPFLYLRGPMIPSLSLRGMAVMGGLALLLILPFLPRTAGAGPGTASHTRRLGLDAQMFFLGAGFMLIETKAVVQMALLFGSTWMVNSVVFFAVLVMILVANLFVLRARPREVRTYYVALLVALTAGALVPLDVFLGLNRTAQVIGSCVLAFTPILFAAVVFAVAFSRTTEPDRAFGANIAGAMVGGLAENASMLLGFQHLVALAMAFYVASAIDGWRRDRRAPAIGDTVVPASSALGRP